MPAGAQLGDLAPPAQARERPRRVGAAGHDEVHWRRQMLEQASEIVVDLGDRDCVQIVEHEDTARRRVRDLVDHGRQVWSDRRGDGAACGVGDLTDPRVNGLQGADRVGPESYRVIVIAIE